MSHAGGPLNFNLTSTGLWLTGRTSSVEELEAFIDRLKALADLIPELWPASGIEGEAGDREDGLHPEGESPVPKADAP